MKRRTRNKIFKRFCDTHRVKPEYFEIQGRTRREIIANLLWQLDCLMEDFYSRQF